MTEMSMNKVIHGAFRRDLDRFITALDSFQAGDQRRADELNKAWANFDDQLTHHHKGEHETAWPALEQVGVSPDAGPGAGRPRASGFRAAAHGHGGPPRP